MASEKVLCNMLMTQHPLLNFPMLEILQKAHRLS